MLQALDAVTGLCVSGEEARRDGRYLCPECRKLVGPRLGGRKVPHFAHFSRTLYRLAQPESPRHRALKWLCKRLFAPLTVDWEVPVGSRRVDAMVDKMFVIECQASALSIQEWQARTENHNRAGFPVLWLWDVKRLCRKNTLEESLVMERNGRAVWVASEIRECHSESRDLLYVADKHAILPCRLITLTSGEIAAAKRGWPEAFFRPNALRKMAFLPRIDKNVRFHFASRTRGLRSVRFGCETNKQ
jgi:competence CoiA-like predicted nuclease